MLTVTETMLPEEAGAFLSQMPDPESVRKLEAMVGQLPQVDLQTQLVIHGGMVARTIFIPAGTVLTGVLTNLDNISVMVGDITVTTDHGPKRLAGFNVIPANAGFKRAGIAHADTYWTTFHHTTLTEIEAIEREMTDEPDNLQTRRQALAAPEQPELIGE